MSFHFSLFPAANVSTCRTSRRSAASGRKRKAPSALESDGDDAGPKADSDARVLWSVNWPRLERLFRDQVEKISRKINY